MCANYFYYLWTRKHEQKFQLSLICINTSSKIKEIFIFFKHFKDFLESQNGLQTISFSYLYENTHKMEYTFLGGLCFIEVNFTYFADITSN